MKRYIIVLLLAFIFVGCGGSSNPSTNVESSKLTGIAVDDLIINGKVKAYAASNPANILANGRTDNNGAYVLNVSYDGVVIVEVTCEVDISWMYNPLTPEIEKIPCVEGLKLNSAATVTPKKKEITVHISPITELVVRQMKERGAPTKKNLEAAQNNIGDMFDFDPLGESPVENHQYAKVIGAIHDLVDDEETILDVIDELNDDYKDGEAGNDESTISKEFAAAMIAVGANNDLTKNDGVFTPSDDSIVISDINLSKQFFNELRTQAMSVVDYENSGTPGFLDNEAESIGTALENVTMDVKTASSYAVGIITDILHLIDEQSAGDTNEVDETTSIVYTKTSALIWTYSIQEDDEEKYAGIVTLPSENPKDISLQSFTGTLNVKFDGTLPLDGDAFDDGESETASVQETVSRKVRAIAADAQTFKADISLIKQGYGADFVLSNVSLLSQGTSLALTDFILSAYYTFDAEDELIMNYITFGGATLTGNTGAYSFNGKLEIPEYVFNDSIKDNNFTKDEYGTYIHAGAFCLDEHNQKTNLVDGTAVYTDVSDTEHEININSWGSFYTNIDGNVEGLDPDNYGNGSVSASDPYGDGNYSEYIGLKFNNISMISDSCQNIVLEHLQITVIDGDTNINGRIFCVEDENQREFEYEYDENNAPTSDIIASFTDTNSVKHTLEVHGGSMQAKYEGNSESIAIDGAWYSAEPDPQGLVNFNRTTIESSCVKPQLEYLNISVKPDYENILYTDIQGHFVCMDNDMHSEISEANITYTDKSGTVHLFDNQSFMLQNSGGHFNGRIEGNVESLALNMGQKHYSAAGFINTVEAGNIEIINSSCGNPQLSYFHIGLDRDEEFFNSGYVPKKVNFDGNITNTATNGAISGSITVDWLNATTMNLLEDSEDTPLVDVSVIGKIKMPERPEMILNLGYTNPGEDNNFTFNYAYDSTSITGTGDFDKEMQNGDIVLSSHHGLRAVIKIVNGDVIYGSDSSVTRNGAPVGTLEERQGVPVILYTDGTFESLP